MSNSLSELWRSALLTVLLLTVVIQPLPAQNNNESTRNVREMSLEEVLQIAEQENFQIRMAEADIEIMRSQYRQTNAVFLPQISLEETGVSTNDPLNVFGFKLKQESATTADFNPARLNAPDLYENFTSKLQVQQPLFNPDQLFRRSAVKNQLNAARGRPSVATASNRSTVSKGIIRRAQSENSGCSWHCTHSESVYFS